VRADLEVSGHRKAFQRLTGHARDQLEVLVDVQDREAGQLRCGRHQQVRDTRRSVLAGIGQHQLQSSARCSMAGVRNSSGMLASGGDTSAVRSAAPDRAE